MNAPLDVAEQLAFEQCLGERGAILGHEHLVLARAIEVQGARDQLLAGSALALDHDRHVAGGDTFQKIEDLLHRGRAPDDLPVARTLAHDRFQPAILDFEFGAPARVLERQGGVIGERLDESQIFASERLPLTAAVEVDGSDDPPARTHRHTHQRADTKQADALEVLEPVVLARVERQNRFAALGLLHDAPADGFDVGFGLFFEVAGQAHGKIRSRGTRQQDHPALGVDRLHGHLQARFEQRLRVVLGIERSDHVVERFDALRFRLLRDRGQELADHRLVQEVAAPVGVFDPARGQLNQLVAFDPARVRFVRAAEGCQGIGQGELNSAEEMWNDRGSRRRGNILQ